MIISVVVGVIGIIAIAVIGAVTSPSGSVSSTPVPPTGAPSFIPSIKTRTQGTCVLTSCVSLRLLLVFNLLFQNVYHQQAFWYER